MPGLWSIKFGRFGEPFVPPQVSRPGATMIANGWTPVGAATLHEAIDEAAESDADYAESPDAVVTIPALFEVTLPGLLDPQVSTGHDLRYRYGKSIIVGDRVDIVARLLQVVLEDNFNRANGSLSGQTTTRGNTWSTTPLEGGSFFAQVIGNQLVPTGTAYITTDFGPDVEVQTRIASYTGTSSDTISLFARCVQVGATTWDGYEGRFLHGTGWQLRRWTNNTPTQIGSTVAAPTPANGDFFALSCIGSIIRLMHKTAAATEWTVLLAVSDATYSAAGKIGVGTNEAAMNFDDLRVGEFIASWTHTDVSGTPQTVLQTLTAPQADAITSYPDLRLRFEEFKV